MEGLIAIFCELFGLSEFLWSHLVLFHAELYSKVWVYLGVKTCEVFLCFVTIMFVLSILTSLFSLFYITCEGDRFLHRG